MVSLSSTPSARDGAVLVLCLVLVSTVGPIVTATPVAQEQKQRHEQKQNQRHTLVIVHVSGSSSWSLTASGSIRLDANTTEETDSIGGKTASGSVGGLPWDDNASDSRDVIFYTGEVLQFDLGGTGTARVKLDGQRVDPQSLKNTPTATPTTTPTATAPSAPTLTETNSPTSLGTPTPPTSVSPTTPTPTVTATPAPSSDERGALRWGPFDLLLGLAVAGVLVGLFLRHL